MQGCHIGDRSDHYLIFTRQVSSILSQLNLIGSFKSTILQRTLQERRQTTEQQIKELQLELQRSTADQVDLPCHSLFHTQKLLSSA